MHECNGKQANVEVCVCGDASVQTLLFAAYAQMQKRSDVISFGAPRRQQRSAKATQTCLNQKRAFQRKPYVRDQNGHMCFATPQGTESV